MSHWGLTYKGTEPLSPEEWNRVIDALEELDTRIAVKRQGGLATFSGDGMSVDFEITHDFGGVPDLALVGEASEDAIGEKWWEVSETSLIIHFISPPPAGIDNVKLWYLILKFAR